MVVNISSVSLIAFVLPFFFPQALLLFSRHEKVWHLFVTVLIFDGPALTAARGNGCLHSTVIMVALLPAVAMMRDAQACCRSAFKLNSSHSSTFKRRAKINPGVRRFSNLQNCCYEHFLIAQRLAYMNLK